MTSVVMNVTTSALTDVTTWTVAESRYERGCISVANYYCEWCDSFFDEPKVIHDYNFSDGKYYVCPVCGEEDLEEASTCVACGDDVKPHEILCKDCRKAFKDELTELQLKYNLSDEDMGTLAEDIIL